MAENNSSAPAAIRRVRSTSDLVIAFLAIAGGGAIVIYASGMPRLVTGQLGTGLFPTVVGIMLSLFGMALVFQTLRPRKKQAGAAAREDEGESGELPANVLEIEPLAAELIAEDAAAVPGGGAPSTPMDDDAGGESSVTVAEESSARLAVNALVVGGSVLAYILLADVVGFLPVMLLILIAIQKVLGGSWVSAILVSIGLTAGLYLVFEKLLLVQLPNGIVGI